jgi:hypothetical protein
MEVRNSCRLHLPGARTPGRSTPVIPLLPRFDTDLLSARANQDALTCRYGGPARRLVDDLSALIEGPDHLAVVRHLAGRPVQDGGHAVAAIRSSAVGEIADGAPRAIAPERGVP